MFRDCRAKLSHARGQPSRHTATVQWQVAYNGCSVRYAPEHGYFTVVKAPDLPVFVEEPAVNTLHRVASDLNGAAAAKAAPTVTRMFPETGCASKINKSVRLVTSSARSGTRYAGLVYCLRIASKIRARLSAADSCPEFSTRATASAIALSLMASRNHAE